MSKMVKFSDKLRPFIRETVRERLKEANPYLGQPESSKLLNNLVHSIIQKGLAPLYL